MHGGEGGGFADSGDFAEGILGGIEGAEASVVAVRAGDLVALPVG